MIVYDLYCENGHVFEGWFDDSADYRSQKDRGLITCPVCDSNHIEIRISAVGVKRASSGDSFGAYDDDGDKMDIRETIEAMEALKDYVHTNFEDVGQDFAKEVLKMHYGVKESRNVRGVSSPEEERQLEKEGVSFFKLPMTETKNKKN